MTLTCVIRDDTILPRTAIGCGSRRRLEPLEQLFETLDARALALDFLLEARKLRAALVCAGVYGKKKQDCAEEDGDRLPA